MDVACMLYKKNKETEFIVVSGYSKNSDKSEKAENIVSFLKENCPNIKITSINSLAYTRHNSVAIFNTWEKL